MEQLTAPLQSLAWVERDTLMPNNYNPNKVLEDNLRLLTESIFANGWTLPIVTRPNGTIIDGFHRWTIAGPGWTYIPPKQGEKTLYELLEGLVPRVIVEHEDQTGDIIGTVTHNRARGTHLLEPMKRLVKQLLDSGMSTKDAARKLGMKEEEIFRLSDFSREEFLAMMARNKEYSPAQIVTQI